MGIHLIAAIDRKRAIGRDGTMPWHLPDDFRHFKTLTLGKPVLMGRKTARSIGKALPGRPNWVLSRQGEAPFADQLVLRSLDEALEKASGRELMVIGGGEIYAQTLPLAEFLHLTEVDTVITGADTWFPAFERHDWHETARRHHPADERHAHRFDFVDYRRVE